MEFLDITILWTMWYLGLKSEIKFISLFINLLLFNMNFFNLNLNLQKKFKFKFKISKILT